MNPLAKLALDVRIALAKHPKVTVNHPKPKRLWRQLKKELPVCDVTFDERAVYVSWKVAELTEHSPEERFAERVYESGLKRREQEAFIRNRATNEEGETDEGEKLIPGRYVSVVLAEGKIRP